MALSLRRDRTDDEEREASRDTVQKLLKLYIPEWRKNKERVDKIDRWYRDRLEAEDKPVIPNAANREYRELRDRSQTPWLGLIVTSVAQSIFVDGYRRPEDPGNAAAWEFWQANGLDGKQMMIHRDALAHGLAYTVVQPGLDPLSGTEMPVIEGVSSIDMIAMYTNPAWDEWPTYALRGDAMHLVGGQKTMRWTFYDTDSVWTFDGDEGSDTPLFIESQPHGAAVCPVVRFANKMDLRGRSDGEVEPFIPLASRINQDTFDRMVVGRFGAWRVRYATGMAEPDTDDEKRAVKLVLKQGDLLVNESPDGRFGTLEPTSLDGYIKSEENDIRELAATSQTPSHEMLGQMANLSAEALAAAEASLMRKVSERQHSFGESWEQTLRLAAHVSGDNAGAAAFDAQVRWRDTESRSLAQAADAITKLHQIGVPFEMLLEKLPGWTQQDVERAKQLVEANDPFAGFADQLAGGMTPAEDPAETKAKADAMGVLVRAGVDPLDAAARVGFSGLKFTGAVPTSLRIPESQAGALEE